MGSRAVNFCDRVFEIVRDVPRGKVTTYGQVADLIQGSSLKVDRRFLPRLVGFVLHQNKSLGVPCHRVVDRNGRLAVNFAFNGWKEQRRRLIEEDVKFADVMHVDLEKCIWQR